MGKILRVVKQPHSVVRATMATLTCSGSYGSLGVSRGRTPPFFPLRAAAFVTKTP